jgi:hypothetical protein
LIEQQQTRGAITQVETDQAIFLIVVRADEQIAVLMQSTVKGDFLTEKDFDSLSNDARLRQRWTTMAAIHYAAEM